MLPGEILEAQMDLVERLEENPMFADSIAHLTAFHTRGVEPLDPWSDFAKANPDIVKARRDELSKESARSQWGADRLHRYAKAAYAYRVTSDMSVMVQFAASQLDADDIFDSSFAPTGCGIVCFDKPLPVKDIRGKTMLIHWLVWGPSPDPARPGLAVFEFNDNWREPDEIQRYFKEVVGQESGPGAWERVMKMQGRWATVGMGVFQNGFSLGDPEWLPNEEQRRRAIKEGFEPQKGTNTMRYLHALFLLLNQTVTKVEDDEMADRPTRRRAKKKGMPQKVSVIKLRREVSNLKREPGESHVEWSHRWVVRDHWAWRKCSESHKFAQPYEKGWRVRVYIHHYDKGPVDKPLVITDKVYSLER